MSRAPLHPAPRAGVDVHAADALGRLCVSDEGLLRRELLVLDTCLSQGVPLAGYVGGGYDDDLEVCCPGLCLCVCGGGAALQGARGAGRGAGLRPAVDRALDQMSHARSAAAAAAALAPQVLAARHCALHEAGLRMWRDHGL